MRALLPAALAACLLALPAAAQDGRLGQILERLDNANLWRDHVMVVAHRGGAGQGERALPENSLASVARAIRLGVEMVEIDVRRSADGVYVVMHDTYLDRTTTCRGPAADRDLDDLRACRLVVEATGRVTGEGVPTLREMLELTKGRVLVNIDNKIGPQHIAGIMEVVRGLGMADQVILKENLWNEYRLAAVRTDVERSGPDVRFMPVIADDAVTDPAFVEEATQIFRPSAVEMIAWRGDAAGLRTQAGPLFGARTRAVAARGDWHIWVNTFAIVNLPGGTLARGRGDELAIAAGLPEEVFGYWAEQGATIIQTDAPREAIDWLEKNGYRRPYSFTN
jgi:glycerophosphoryl diester phosphodiesterase